METENLEILLKITRQSLLEEKQRKSNRILFEENDEGPMLTLLRIKIRILHVRRLL